MNNTELTKIAREIRLKTIKLLFEASSGHPGSSLSMADILTALYFQPILKFDPKCPNWEGRDYFLLSVGHAVPVMYSTLTLAGYYPKAKLKGLRKFGTDLHGHAKRGTFPGIEISAGSLGQGLSVGVGLGLALNLDKKAGNSSQVIVMMSDGEQEEGSTWEALMFASKHKLDNIIAVIDKNGSQINGPTSVVMPSLDPLGDKYKAFGWDVLEIDGHSFSQITKAFKEGYSSKKPFAIIAHTIMGKGVSFMEGDYKWHHGKLTEEQYKQALEDLSYEIL